MHYFKMMIRGFSHNIMLINNKMLQITFQTTKYGKKNEFSHLEYTIDTF